MHNVVLEQVYLLFLSKFVTVIVIMEFVIVYNAQYYAYFGTS